MKSVIFTFLSLLLADLLFSQSAPPAHLKYFGFAIVDCGLDDPNDAPVLTNYIHEVDSFSNVAQMCVSSHTDTIVNRLNLMNSLCVKPILSTSSIFIYLANSNGPSGSNYDLYPNYQARWDSFKVANASVLSASQVEVFYICDEPTWNGVTFSELSIISNTIKADFPNIPQMFIEAYTEVASVQVPTTVDWIGFDHYGIADVSTDANYLAWLDTLESRRSTPNQKIWLVFDDEWNSGFWPGSFQPDTMEQVFSHYYDLALADTNVIGLAGFTWPGIAPGWLGARSLPQHVIDKSVQIGKMIKANYNPCSAVIKDEETSPAKISVYPSPAADKLNIVFDKPAAAASICFYNGVGETVKEMHSLQQKTVVSVHDMAQGIYFYKATSANGTILASGKFVKE